MLENGELQEQDKINETEIMPEYILLFNGITEALRDVQFLTDRLKYLQMRAEECYMEKADSQAIEEHQAVVS